MVWFFKRAAKESNYNIKRLFSPLHLIFSLHWLQTVRVPGEITTDIGWSEWLEGLCEPVGETAVLHVQPGHITSQCQDATGQIQSQRELRSKVGCCYHLH